MEDAAVQLPEILARPVWVDDRIVDVVRHWIPFHQARTCSCDMARRYLSTNVRAQSSRLSARQSSKPALSSPRR